MSTEKLMMEWDIKTQSNIIIPKLHIYKEL